MSLSTHAQAAKMIRTELKKRGIKARVIASSASMTSSVDVYVCNQPKEVFEEIESFANKFQYGHFDGMTDCYEYSNTDENLPQVKFVFCYNE